MDPSSLRGFAFLIAIAFIEIASIKADEEKSAISNNNFPAAQSNDLRIVTRAEWGAQPPTDLPRRLKVQPAPYAIIGHTATQSCYNEAKCALNVRVIQTFHIEAKGWVDVGYNFLVGGNGHVYEGRGWDNAGAHTHNYNNRSIGLAFVGDFAYKSPHGEQLASAARLLELGVKMGKLAKDYKLMGQRQLVHTQSPGDKLYNAIKSWEHWSSEP